MSREVATLRDLRRQQVVAAARGIVAQHGLEALTFAALERELGYTRGVITWHFRNKDEIVAAVLQDAVEDIDRVALPAIVAEQTFTDRARAVLREMVKGWLAGDAAPVLVTFWGRLQTDADAAETNASLYRRYREYSSELVRRGQAAGEFDPTLDPEAMGVVLVGLVIGIALQELFDPGAVDVESAIRAASDTVVARLTGARGSL